MATPISRNSKEVFVGHRLNWDAFDNLRKAIYLRVTRFGQRSLIIDFQNTQVILPNGIVPLIALLKKYQQMGVSVSVVPPRAVALNEIARHEGWFYAIDPERFTRPATSTAYKTLPLRPFATDDELNSAVNDAIQVALRNVSMAKSVAGAFEWALNELGGNVLHHAQAECGFIQVNTFPQKHTLSIVVADGGIGVPRSMRERFSDLSNDRIALEQAIQKGVTSKPSYGQGNGLAGCVAISINSDATFAITSGGGRVVVQGGILKQLDFAPPLDGTVVELQLPTNKEIDLPSALWGHDPSTYLEEQFENDTGDRRVVLRECAPTFGNRVTGERIRTLIQNLVDDAPNSELVIDFDGVNMVASSFADEVFGKLFLRMGPIAFASRIRFHNLNGTCKKLIDTAITERMIQGSG